MPNDRDYRKLSGRDFGFNSAYLCVTICCEKLSKLAYLRLKTFSFANMQVLNNLLSDISKGLNVGVEYEKQISSDGVA